MKPWSLNRKPLRLSYTFGVRAYIYTLKKWKVNMSADIDPPVPSVALFVASYFDMVCIPRRFSAHHSCKVQLFELP